MTLAIVAFRLKKMNIIAPSRISSDSGYPLSLPQVGAILTAMYEIFEHTADLGLRVRAGDLPTLFVDAARGLTSMIATNLDGIQPVRVVPLRVESDSLDLLLFDWLTEILYLFESEHLLLCQFDVRLAGNVLEAVARGEPLDESRHQLEHEVKAITYHRLKVEQTPDGWLAEVIVDI